MNLLHRLSSPLLIACLAAIGFFFTSAPAKAAKNGGTDYSITAFGAIANDGVDDSAAIAAAIAAASSAGDRVIVPAGTFSIISNIRPASGNILIGAGRDLSTIEYIGSRTARTSMIDLSRRSNVEITNLTFDAKLNPGVNNGIRASGGSGINISENRIMNLGGMPAFGPHAITFNDGGSGTEGGVTDSTISGNELLNVGINAKWGAGIRFSSSSRNVIDGNMIDGTGRGGILTNQGVFGNGGSGDLTIINNLIRNSDQASTGAGISIELFPGGGNTLIENNDVDHWISIIGSERVAVRGNKIQDPDNSLGSYGLEAYDSLSVVFSDNQIGAGQQLGILTGGTSSPPTNGRNGEILFLRNIFESMESNGTLLGGGPVSTLAYPTSRIYLRENEFVGQPENGIKDTGGGGIVLTLTLSSVVLDSNIIRDFDGPAVQFTGQATGLVDYLEVINNDIIGNGDAFSRTEFQGTNAFIDGNTIIDNGDNSLLASKGNFDGNARPEVEILAPAFATVGEEVEFSFIWTDDGTVDGILWDLSEGLPEVTSTVTRTFSSEGTFNISLVVWDDGGRGTFDDLQITIVGSTSQSIFMDGFEN
ncbi:MAG: right-handed parallel beta-helix repeat-containing protein [Xanthomonadales bacterium]|nr:right-handed parallel beta-helix repeat-containing protein [Xanthomonadales bacterium]